MEKRKGIGALSSSLSGNTEGRGPATLGEFPVSLTCEPAGRAQASTRKQVLKTKRCPGCALLWGPDTGHQPGTGGRRGSQNRELGIRGQDEIQSTP